MIFMFMNDHMPFQLVSISLVVDREHRQKDPAQVLLSPMVDFVHPNFKQRALGDSQPSLPEQFRRRFVQHLGPQQPEQQVKYCCSNQQYDRQQNDDHHTLLQSHQDVRPIDFQCRSSRRLLQCSAQHLGGGNGCVVAAIIAAIRCLGGCCRCGWRVEWHTAPA